MRAVFLALCVVASGCTAGPEVSRTLDHRPSVLQRLGSSAANAVRSKDVWIPVAGAAFLQIGSLDEDLSEWAIRERPIFHSQSDAALASDRMRQTASLSYFAATLASHRYCRDGWSSRNVSRDCLVGFAAYQLNYHATDEIKSRVGRGRPSGDNDRSFPSRHASSTAVWSRLATLQLEECDEHPKVRDAFAKGMTTLSLGTGWARVEAAQHYPSDVLVGYALGNFSARFLDNRFSSNDELHVSTQKSGDAVVVGFNFSFR